AADRATRRGCARASPAERDTKLRRSLAANHRQFLQPAQLRSLRLPPCDAGRSTRRPESQCAGAPVRRPSTRPSEHYQGFDKPVRPIARHVQGVSKPLEREAMRIKRAGCEAPGFDSFDGGANTLKINIWIALVGIDHVKPAPVPQPHIHLSWP